MKLLWSEWEMTAFPSALIVFCRFILLIVVLSSLSFCRTAVAGSVLECEQTTKAGHGFLTPKDLGWDEKGDENKKVYTWEDLGTPPLPTIDQAEAGDVTAMILIASCLWDLKTKEGWKGGESWYRKAIAQKSGRAAFELAQKYHLGDGVPANLEQAIRLYETAIEYDDWEAAYVLGAMYLRGDGVIEDYVRAAMYLEKSAEGGYPLGQYAYGEMLEDGIVSPPDLVAAYKWYILADYLRFGNTRKDLIQKKMTREQIIAGQRAANEWLSRNVQK